MAEFNRRAFLRMSGSMALLAGGLGAMPLLSGCGRQESGAAEDLVAQRPFGLQLYTLRDVIQEDPEAVLRQLASFGYKQIESYEGPQGIYWGMGNKGFKSLMDELEMNMISSHVNNFDDFDSFARKADEAAEIGVKYLICPYAKQETLDDYKELAQKFNRAGEIANQAGIRFAYHNHGYTFQKVDGEYPQDLLMRRCDPELMDFELDIYWVAAVNEDPAAWLKRYPNRFKLGHVKDIKRNGEPQTTTLGQGEIDWATLLPLARVQGMEYFIVEQEQYEGTTPIKAVEDNAQFMSKLTF